MVMEKLYRQTGDAAPVSADTVVGRLAAELPGAVQVFERFGIRYCCRGRQTLGGACAGEGLDLREVLRELERCGTGLEGRPGRLNASLTEIVDHIEQFHYGYLEDTLPALESLVGRVADVHGNRHPELVELRRVFGRLGLDLAEHRIEEVEVVFPMCRALDAARHRPDSYWRTVKNPVGVMIGEHEDLARTLEELRELTAGFDPPLDACDAHQAMLKNLAALERRLRIHVHQENNVLFPKAVAVEAALSRW